VGGSRVATLAVAAITAAVLARRRQLLDVSDGRAAQKARFGGELFPNVVEAESGLEFAEFFRNERDTGRKGIVVLRIGGSS
jgi:hypothetical protein